MGYKTNAYINKRPLHFEEVGEIMPITSSYKVSININTGCIISNLKTLAEKITNFRDSCGRVDCNPRISTIEGKLINDIYRMKDIMVHPRQKRDVWFPSLGKAISKVTGLVDSDQKELIDIKITTLKDKMKEEIELNEETRKTLTDITPQILNTIENVKRLDTNLQNFRDEAAKERAGIILNQFELAAVEIREIVNAIFQILNEQKIQGLLVSHENLEEIFNAIKTKLHNKQTIPFESALEAMWHLTPKAKTTNDGIKVEIDVPAVLNQQWKIFKITTWPINNEGIMVFIMSHEKAIVQDNKGNLAMIESVESFVQNSNGTFIGELKQPFHSNASDTCIMRFFRQHKIDEKLCEKELHHAKINSSIVKIDRANIIVFPSTTLEAREECDGKEENFLIKIDTIITPNGNCMLHINDLSFMAITNEKQQFNFSAILNISDISFPTYERKYIPLIPNAPMEMEKLHEHMKRLNELKVEKINESIFEDQKTSFWVSIGSAASTIFVFIIVVMIICCCIKI